MNEQECIPVGCVPPAAVAFYREGGVCCSACWDTHTHTPPQVWAWIPPLGVGLDPLRLWGWRPPPRCGPGYPRGCGPGDPPGQTSQLPPWVWDWRPPLETCKACWDRQTRLKHNPRNLRLREVKM